MKVLIAGEASVHLANYCRAIKPHVAEIVFISETPYNIPEAERSYLVSFREANPLRWLLSLRKLKNIIDREKPDIIHVHQINRLAYFISVAAKALGVPQVATAWGSDVLIVPQRNFIYKMISAYVLRNSLKITADAGAMIGAMRQMDNTPSKYILLQYGIDSVQPGAKEQVIFSNRLHERLYNIDKVIEDFAEFSEKHPEWKLCIAGSGSETENLKKLAVRLGMSDRIRFLGWLDKQSNHANYSKASVFVSIPDSDGTSVSLLEAMSADCIPVVSDLPVSREWIEHGVNGIIRSPGKNPFEEALTIDREKCFKINREKIKLHALREQTARQFFRIYEDVLGRHRK
jgi:L-malate glycosyltransferase